jgi:hypothetical protein
MGERRPKLYCIVRVALRIAVQLYNCTIVSPLYFLVNAWREQVQRHKLHSSAK